MIRLSTAYLPPVSWFARLAAAGEAVVEQHEHYAKQTIRNRCRIAMPDGPANLVVPVREASSHAPIRDLRLSDHGHWQHHHWNALRTAYGKSPFFEFYADDFAPFYLARPYEFLLDFNEALRSLVCDLIDLPAPVHRSAAYAPLTDEASLPAFSPRPYYQVFAPRLGFLPDLSIVDLLFNMGPESILVLRDSVASPSSPR